MGFSLGTYSQINLDSGLVAYYPFEGNADDMSVNALDGTPFNVVYGQGVYGPPDSSIFFNGTDTSYVDCGTDNRGITDTIAVSCFFRTSFNGIGDIVSKYDPGNDRGYHLQMNLGKIRFAGRDGGGSYRSTGLSLTTVNDSAWHHVLGVVRGNTWLLYIDCNLEGAQSNATANPDISSNAELGIGKDVFGNAKYLDCEVDEVRIYNRELWPDEMDSLCATAVFAKIDEPSEKPAELSVYPNPVEDVLIITSNISLANSQIEIYNLSGQKVSSRISENSAIKLDVSLMESGNYIIRVIQKNKIFYSRFLKL